jgi:hypothetical protein
MYASVNIISETYRTSGYYYVEMSISCPLNRSICGQCCGAETFCFRSGSGSNFQKVSALAPAPEPAPAPTLALHLPFITDFILKSGFFMFFMKEYQPNSHAGFYTI